MRYVTVVLVLTVLLSAGTVALGEVPHLINYQGVLTDSGDLPLTGQYDLTFSVYPDSMQATSYLWTEDHLDVDVDNGLFNVILGGSATLFDGLFEYPELWMGITVEGGAEMVPRMKMTSVPWAMRAAIADSVAGGGSGADADWVIDGTDMHTGPSVTGNVGIGVSDPARKFHIRGSGFRYDRDANSAFFSLHRFPSGDFTTPWKGFMFAVDAYGPNDGTFRISDWDTSLSGGSTTRLLIDTDGDVGIGTATPSAKLDIAGEIKVEGFTMPTGAVNGYVLKSNASGTGTWQSVGSTITDDDWIIDGDDIYTAQSGDVGIGASPSRGRFCVYADQGNAAYLSNLGPDYNQDLYLCSEEYVIDATGDVAISAVADSIGIITMHDPTGIYAKLATATYAVRGVNRVGGGTRQVELATEHFAVYGESDSCGIYGYSEGSSGANSIGVMGQCLTGTGVYGKVGDGQAGVLGEALFTYGVHGVCTGNGNEGILGAPGYGIYGQSQDDPAVWGYSVHAEGVKGYTTDGYGVKAYANDGYGVYSTVTLQAARGVYAKNLGSNSEAYLAGDGYSVYGENVNTGHYGYIADADYGVYGSHPGSNSEGYIGGAYGVYGRNTSSGNFGALGAATYAGYFDGDITVKSKTTNNAPVEVLASDGSDLLKVNETSGGAGSLTLCDADGTVQVTVSSTSFTSFNGGNVGINVGVPTERLTVKGNILILSEYDGSSILELGEGLDYAEGFDVTEAAGIEAGTVLSIDPENPGNLTKSTRAYDSRVAGIVAGGKGLGSGVRLGVDNFDHDVALAGRVYCKVIATDGAIEPGDLLTTSDVPGFAMKAEDPGRSQGAILGKAMEPLARGEVGEILVLVALQ
ncbi:hypothetical protein ACFL2Z_01570 [Candidatus Eisenbacteria bacterium]|uniref:Uncharacterized protein n=1 Tax=Eiseniibacteriota bacterium TaxID=2212470 RepID=A0ABV6YNE2_UNCEI